MNRLFAIIILVAVAISMSAAAVAWITTTYHSMRWRPEVLRILDVDMYLNSSDGKWWLKIVALNEGEEAAEIYRIEVHGVETLDLRPPETIRAGDRKEIHVRLWKEYAYGTTYTIKLYLRSGTIYPVLKEVTEVVRP